MGNPGKFENYNDTLPLSVKTYKTRCLLLEGNNLFNRTKPLTLVLLACLYGKNLTPLLL